MEQYGQDVAFARRAVLATLEEKGAFYRLAPAALGTLRSPEHLALHPFGRVPVLEHDGFRLYETQAILRYLDRVLPTPALTPSDPGRAARMNQVMNVNDWYLYQGVGDVIIFHRIVGPRVTGLMPDEAAIEAALPKAHVVFNGLAQLLGEQRWFAGDAISLADLMIAPPLNSSRPRRNGPCSARRTPISSPGWRECRSGQARRRRLGRGFLNWRRRRDQTRGARVAAALVGASGQAVRSNKPYSFSGMKRVLDA